MIKNYCIKIISSVFLMLTIFMVSTSVFATELSETYSNLYTLSSLSDENIPLLDASITDGKAVMYYKNSSHNKEAYKNNILAVVTTSDCDFLGLHRANTTYNNWYIEAFALNNNVYDLVYGYTIYVYKDGVWSANGSQDLRALYSGYPFNPTTPFVIYKESNFDLYYSSNSTLTNPSAFNFVKIFDAQEASAKKIIYEVNYSEDNKTAMLSAEIKNCAEGDKLYYSLLGYSITGKLMNPIELNQSQATAISLNKNTLIHLQALDSER